MGGESAVQYGIIDHVLVTRGDLPTEATSAKT
jgi:ATP-dependent protease ClpP protease subunit